jgi:hypothetical protein
MRLAHLIEALQGFVGNKLIGVGQTRPGGGNTQRSHLRETATGAMVHRDFTVLCAIFHKLMTHVFRVIQNIESRGGSIEHLGETFFLDAVGGDPVIGHLTKENKEWSGLHNENTILHNLIDPTSLNWLLNLRFMPRGFLQPMVSVLQPRMALIPPKIPRSKNWSI